MTDLEFAIAFRAALIQEAKSLQEQRAAVLAQVAALEQKYGLGKHADKPAAARIFVPSGETEAD
jgi:hypothetical protein